MTSQGGGTHPEEELRRGHKPAVYQRPRAAGRPWQPAAVNIRLKAPCDALQLPVKDVYSRKDCPGGRRRGEGPRAGRGHRGLADPKVPGRVTITKVVRDAHFSYMLLLVINMRQHKRMVTTE